MELIAAILIAGPLGYFIRPRKRALLLYLVAWAVIFPIQTVVVHSANSDDIEPLYFVFNALILGLGVTLNEAGSRLAGRRASAA